MILEFSVLSRNKVYIAAVKYFTFQKLIVYVRVLEEDLYIMKLFNPRLISLRIRILVIVKGLLIAPRLM